MRMRVRMPAALLAAALSLSPWSVAPAARNEGASAPATAVGRPAEKRVTVEIDSSLDEGPVTGRLFLLLSKGATGREPRLSMPYTFAYYMNEPSIPYPQVFGVDVEALEPGEPVTFDDGTLGHPLASLADVPEGAYSVQAVLHVYTRFQRSDGHTVWAPMDQGEGQQFHLSPGNLVSEVRRVQIDPAESLSLELPLTRVLPPFSRSPDSEYVRRLRIKSELVSEFWGRDVFVNATVLLPRGYEEHPDVSYPVVYYQGHFFEDPPFNFPEAVPADARESRPLYFPNHAFRGAWLSDDFPRMIAVTFQHPTPFYDDSYFIDSANNGPWGRAFVEEIVPAVEEEFRIIREGYARVMTGGSTGGWVSAALQIYHPTFFGGAWSFCPDPVDFRDLVTVDIYRDRNAFYRSGYTWKAPERAVSRTPRGYPRMTVRELSNLSRVLGSRGRSGEVFDLWNALFSPVGEDGYPLPLWDHETGVIDREVAEHWRDAGYDLRAYLERNWSEIGPDLVGKLRFICGDMDDFYLNLAVYRMEEFLESTTDPYYGGSFLYGRPMVGHGLYGYQPWPMKILREMADHVAENAPEGADPSAWRY